MLQLNFRINAVWRNTEKHHFAIDVVVLRAREIHVIDGFVSIGIGNVRVAVAGDNHLPYNGPEVQYRDTAAKRLITEIYGGQATRSLDV